MKRLGILTIFSVLFIVFVIVWNYSYQEGLEEAYIPLVGEPELPIIPSERAVFERQGFALDYLDMPVDEEHQRLIKDYYTNKAYPGGSSKYTASGEGKNGFRRKGLFTMPSEWRICR